MGDEVGTEQIRGYGMEPTEASINGKKMNKQTPHMKLQMLSPSYPYMTVAQPSTANIPLFCTIYKLVTIELVKLSSTIHYFFIWYKSSNLLDYTYLIP